jgi:hypothetical protein
MMEIAICPRCILGRLKRWYKLSLEESMVAHRLPQSANYAEDERLGRHRWCIKCWYEESSPGGHLA